MIVAFATQIAAAATTIEELGKITPSNPASWGAAAFSGTTLLVNGPGKVYVFEQGAMGWSETGAGLTAGSDPLNQRFPSGLAVDGATALVGARGAEGEVGAAYLFSRGASEWAPGPSLVPDDPSPDAQFGFAVDIAGTVAAVCAYGDDTAAADSGAVYVFELGGGQWTQTAKLTPAVSVDPLQQYRYMNVQVTSSTVFVLASFYDNLTRRVEVFERTGVTWSQVDTLGSRESGDSFPAVFTADGDTFVGSARGLDGGAGALYVYTRGATAWEYQETLRAPSPQLNEGLGVSVALSGDYIVAGTQGSAPGVEYSGGAVFFKRTGTEWSSGVRFWASDAQAYDYAGTAVALQGQNAAVLSSADKWAHMIHIGAGPGDPCAVDSECADGACADGMCCDDACDGACESCLAADKGDGSPDGTCAPVAPNTDPAEECNDEGATSCGTTGSCDGAGTCALYSEGTVCNPATCASAALVDPADRCDGAGNCVTNDALDACSPLACVDGACNAVCATDADCASGFSCDTTTEECRPASLVCSDDGSSLLDPAGELLARCSPYVCEAGRCLDQCAQSTDCSRGYLCSEMQCVTAAAPTASDGGCGCRALGRSGQREASAALLGLLGIIAARRRRARGNRAIAVGFDEDRANGVGPA